MLINTSSMTQKIRFYTATLPTILIYYVNNLYIYFR